MHPTLPLFFSKKLLVLTILFLAFLVRLWKMEYLPYQNDGDELAYVFAGQSLIEFGVPISWSSFDYNKSSFYKKLHVPNLWNVEDVFNLYRPWFDHPFLLPLLEGSWVTLLGYHFPSISPSLVIRIPMLFLAMITLGLVYKIAKALFGFYPALFSLVLIGFSPGIVVAQRMVMGENLYLPFLLFAYYLVIKKKAFVWIVMLSVLAGLSKITGLITIPLIGFYWVWHKQYRQAIWYGFSSLGGFLILYLGYGFLVDWHSFLVMLQFQSNRLLGWSNPTFLLSHPGFHTRVLLDSSYYLILFLGLAIFFHAHSRKYFYILVNIILSLVAIWLSSGEQDMLGWYKLPLFAWLAIAAGLAIQSKVRFGVVVWVAIAVIANFGLVRFVDHLLPAFPLLRSLVILVVGGLIFVEWLQPNYRFKIYGMSLAILLVVYIGTAFYVVHYQYDAWCRDKLCPIPSLTLKQVTLSWRR